MKTALTVLLLAIAGALSAFEVDSVKRREMIREGQQELCQLLEHNANVTDPSEKQFVVVINGEPAQTYVKQKHVDTLSSQILSQECVDSLNAKLKRTYRDYHIEMYVIVLKTFNLIVHTPLPANISGQSLFNTQLYDNQSNIAQLRAQHASITDEIIQNTFSSRNQDCMVYSRAEYSGSLVPGKTRSWTFSKRVRHYAYPRTYPQLDNLASYFADRIINNINVTQSGLEYSLKAVADEFNEAAKFCALRAQILTTYTSSGMSAIFSQFNEYVDYYSLTVEERIHALGVFAGYAMWDNGYGQEERFACKIVESTPVHQAEMFLAHLSVPSTLRNEPNYSGDLPDEALVVTLIRRIDDSAPLQENKDNYARLMRALTAVSLSNENFVSSHLPSTDQQWLDRQIYWDDWTVLSLPPVGTHDYDITLNATGTLSIDKEVVDRHDSHIQGQTASTYYTAHWDEDYAPIQLNPFDLVIITNRSSLGMIQVAGAQPNQPFLAPAIFLKYCEDKEFNSQAVTTTAVILSAVAVITGPGLIMAAVEAGNTALALFEGLQFVGAVADLIANVSASPALQEAVGIFNSIVGAWGISRLTVSGIKYTADYISGVRANVIGPVPLTTADDYCKRYDLVTDWSNVDEATQAKMKRMRDLLGKQVAEGTIESTTQFSRATINGLNGFSNDIVTLAAQHDLTLEEFIVLEGKAAAEMTAAERSVINQIRNSISSPSSNTIMQKVISRTEIDQYLDGTYSQIGGFVSTCTGTKHLTTYDDLYYGLRLDYKLSDGISQKFHLSDGSCGVIRYTTPNVHQSRIPRSAVNGGVDDASLPYTGHGFTSGMNGRLGAPEWISPYLTPDDGAELWEVFSNGREVLRGRFSKMQNKFITVQ
jgi:hypothetical protein